MIKNALDNSEEFEKIILSSGFLGQKIYADFVSQKNSATNSFYNLEDCAFMLSGTNITLCGTVTPQDVEQITAFAQFFGIKSIENQRKNLPLKVYKTMLIMQYKGKEYKQSVDIIQNDDIYSFMKFCCKNFDDINFDTSYSNFVKKVNAGLSNIYYIKKDKKIISGAISTHYFDNTEYITFVSTDKNYRNKGYSAKILQHIISQNKGKKILLKCEENLFDFYSLQGFEIIDTLTINSLKEQ